LRNNSTNEEKRGTVEETMGLPVNFNTIVHQCRLKVPQHQFSLIEVKDAVIHKRWAHKSPISASPDKSLDGEESNDRVANVGSKSDNEMIDHNGTKTETIERPHNRLTIIYSRMKKVCPEDIKAYAVCVQRANDDNEIGLTKGCCESEFQKVKDCFRRVRYNKL
jgi:hypothetical protein